jgi:hypothetical protein
LVVAQASQRHGGERYVDCSQRGMRQRYGGFARKIPRSEKARAGRTRVEKTPLRIHVTGVHLPADFRPHARELLGRRLGRFATNIERATVRFEDVNGPRGGVDTLCRIQLTVSRRPTVLVESRAADPGAALKRSATAAANAMDRSVGRAGLRTLPPTKTEAAEELPERPATRRVVRPRRRKPGGRPRAAGQAKPTRAKMGYKLEQSATKPSRKSTRKGIHKKKSGSKLRRRQVARTRSPKARATRAKVQRSRV